MELARPAGAEDRSACAHLVALALEAATTMSGGRTLVGDATPAMLLERWTSPEGSSALFVGEYEAVVVGVLGLTEAHTAGGPRGLVECCYVEEAARGVGVGSALMEAAVEWSTRRGCPEIDAVALPGDRATKQRLEASGFTARLLTLSRRLG
jgi:GNAT superfamily N-acetyltransferase